MKPASFALGCFLALAVVACGSHDDDDEPRSRLSDRSDRSDRERPHAREHVAEPPPAASGEPAAPTHLTAAQVRMATARCEAGQARECWLLGAMYERGEGVIGDAAAARRSYERACGMPGGFGCDDLARLDPAEADTYLAVGCDAGRTAACAALGARDPVHGAARLERACTLGDIEACVGLTRRLNDATPAPAGAPTETSRLPTSVTDPTVRAAASHCDENMASMCAWLAMQYLQQGPFGVPVDEDHALELSRRACNETALGGCLLVGEILVTRQTDVATAGTAFNRSCAAGNAEACDAISLVLTGVDEARDDVALARFEACVLGIAEDCAGPG